MTERWHVSLPDAVGERSVDGHVSVDHGVLVVEREMPSSVEGFPNVTEPVLYLAPGTWVSARRLP